MIKSLRDGWLEDLRSGNFKQTEGVLRYTENGEHSYCCLGVLCNRLDPNGYDQYDTFRFSNGETSCGGIVEDVAQELGLTTTIMHKIDGDPYGNPTPTSIEGILVEMNDNLNKSFSEIADWIEANVPVEDPIIDKEYLESMLDGFASDPADTEYQLGYFYAIRDLYKNIGGDLEKYPAPTL